jgi:predicted cupin superfamily sugar epimerase
MTSIATGFIDVLDDARIHLPCEPDHYPADVDAKALIDRLALQRHPEGGWYRETWRAEAPAGERSAGSAILFLLAAGERSHWHRLRDATELWLFQTGDPLELLIRVEHEPTTSMLLGPDLAAGQRLQAIVPAGDWQAARPLGAWTLVSCVVVPGFEFSSFELAPEAWELAG